MKFCEAKKKKVVILDTHSVRSKASEPKVGYSAVQKKCLRKMGTSLSDLKCICVDVKLARHVNSNFKFLEEFPWKLVPTDIFILHNDGHEQWMIVVHFIIKYK